jgi:hypothetical protein
VSKPLSAKQLVLIAYSRTDAQFEEYIHGNYFSGVNSDEFQTVVDQYPSGRFFFFSRDFRVINTGSGRRYAGFSLWHRNSQRSYPPVQEARIHPG